MAIFHLDIVHEPTTKSLCNCTVLFWQLFALSLKAIQTIKLTESVNQASCDIAAL